MIRASTFRISLTFCSDGGVGVEAGGEEEEEERRWAGTEKGVGGPETARMEAEDPSLPRRTTPRAAEASRRM
jgi:hypothetical protein